MRPEVRQRSHRDVGGLLAAGPISRGIAQAIRAPDFQVSYNPWIVVAAVLIGPAVAVLAASVAIVAVVRRRRTRGDA